MNERDTEDRILDAAHTVFVQRGTAGARMQEVADEAGVNKALLHYYFRTKEQLAEAVFQRALRELLPRALEIMRTAPSIEEIVRGIVELQIDILRRNPILPGYLLGELTHYPERVHGLFETAAGMQLSQLGEEVRSHVGEMLAAEAEAGRMRPMAPEHFLMNLISLVLFPFAARPLLKQILDRDEAEYDELMVQRRELLPEFFLNALST